MKRDMFMQGTDAGFSPATGVPHAGGGKEKEDSERGAEGQAIGSMLLCARAMGCRERAMHGGLP